MIGFVYAFPLSPLCVLFHNVVTLRSEANRLIHLSRRPCISKKYDGIGQWTKILDTLTLCGGIINVSEIIFLNKYSNDILFKVYIIAYVGSYYDLLKLQYGKIKSLYSSIFTIN